jgi:hypothetical protein
MGGSEWPLASRWFRSHYGASTPGLSPAQADFIVPLRSRFHLLPSQRSPSPAEKEVMASGLTRHAVERLFQPPALSLLALPRRKGSLETKPVFTQGAAREGWFILDFAGVSQHPFSGTSASSRDLEPQFWARIDGAFARSAPRPGWVGSGAFLRGRAFRAAKPTVAEAVAA